MEREKNLTLTTVFMILTSPRGPKAASWSRKMHDLGRIEAVADSGNHSGGYITCVPAFNRPRIASSPTPRRIAWPDRLKRSSQALASPCRLPQVRLPTMCRSSAAVKSWPYRDRSAPGATGNRSEERRVGKEWRDEGT